MYDESEPFQLLVADLSYSEFLGRLAIGKVVNGTVKGNQEMVCLNEAGK
jgi:GTP-binding protein